MQSTSQITCSLWSINGVVQITELYTKEPFYLHVGGLDSYTAFLCGDKQKISRTSENVKKNLFHPVEDFNLFNDVEEQNTLIVYITHNGLPNEANLEDNYLFKQEFSVKFITDEQVSLCPTKITSEKALRKLIIYRYRGTSTRGKTLASISNDPEKLHTIIEKPDPALNILFIHGLFGDYKATWTNDDKIFWPEQYLRELCDENNIGLYTLQHTGRYANSIKNILEKLDGALVNLKNRPLLIVAHSFGGILAKALIGYYNIAGFIFIGVPHKGVEEVNLASLALCLGFLAGEDDAIKDLKPNSSVLSDIDFCFELWKNSGSESNVVNFYETTPYLQSHIVPEKLTCLGYGEHIPLEDNHSSIAKPKNDRSLIVTKIREVASNII